MSRAYRIVGALALALALVACGDDGSPDPIDPPPPPPPPPAATFTSFVIDLVQNQTKNDTASVASDQFGSLMDPDETNPAAYSSLFQ